jgi:hypothetical protein
MSTPSVSHWTGAVPKGGADAADYEDAAAVSTEPWPVRAAVADGATESVFARAWATRLVRGFVEDSPTTAAAFRDAVSDCQDEWRAAATERATDRPWYVAAKAAEGAFAAVLGLSLHPDGRWQAVSVGDCCLFHLRDGTLLRSWPVDTAEAFTNRPALVPSRSDRDVPSPEATTGSWQPGDRFLLATDAVAAWLMGEDLEAVSRLDSEAFRDRVAAARDDGALRNDDATLLVLELASSLEADEDASYKS